MNSFEKASKVEERGMRILLPYINHNAAHGYTLTSKGTLSRVMQLTVGDVTFNTSDEVMWAAEIKVEEKWTGNLFLETWSNRNLESPKDHAEYGSNRGWLDHCKADWLLYYFLSNDALYVIRLLDLKRWAFGHGSVGPRIHSHPEVMQSKYSQRNDTWGRLVKTDTLKAELPAGAIKKVNPLGLLAEAI